MALDMCMSSLKFCFFKVLHQYLCTIDLSFMVYNIKEKYFGKIPLSTLAETWSDDLILMTLSGSNLPRVNANKKRQHHFFTFWVMTDAQSHISMWPLHCPLILQLSQPYLFFPLRVLHAPFSCPHLTCDFHTY